MTITGLSPDRTHRLHVATDQGKILKVERAAVTSGSDSEPLLVPGLIDVQVNGLRGIAFNDPALSTSQVVEVTETLWRHGVTQYLPTLITDSFDNLSRGIHAIARAVREGDQGRSILGIHLEGPYLSPEDGPRGAHPLEHVRRPDWDEFRRLQDAADQQIRLVTIAPEQPGAIEFIGKAVASGVRVAIGHTAADADCLRSAIGAGACMSTHLGNAAHDRLQRHRNYIYDQLAADDLWASLIVDGHHLPPGLVRIFVRAKRPERVILVSDAAMWAGLAPGIYPWGHCNIEVRADGWIGVVGQPRLAGSGLLLSRGIENVVRFAGVSLCQAVQMATVHPARMLGLTDRLGTVEPERDASLVLMDWHEPECRLRVLRTIVAGETVYEV